MVPIVCPYTQLNPETRAALIGLDAAIVDVSGSEDDYYILLQDLWQRAEGVLLVEHDIVPNPDSISSLLTCPEPWCGGVYQVGINMGSWLGLTKFSPEIMVRVPDAIDRMENTHWRSLDGQLLPYLWQRGFHVHKHWPAVRHINDCADPNIILGSCPCGGAIRFEQARLGPNNVICPKCGGYVNQYPFG